MTPAEMTASTMVDLKKIIRRRMGWPDRRSWTSQERQICSKRFLITVDHARGVFVAMERRETP